MLSPTPALTSSFEKALKFKTCLAQINPILGDFDRNLASHLEVIANARVHGARLCVLPELSLTGYFLKDLVPEIAIRLEDSRLRPLLEASREIDIVVGLVEESTDHRFFNTAIYLHGGACIHAHRKIFLPTYGLFEEQRYFAAGDRIRAFETSFGRAALLTCEDMWHAVPPLVAAQDGALILIVPSAGPLRGSETQPDRDAEPESGATWEVLNRFHAKANGVYVLYANRVGFEDGINFGGGSHVVLPSGRVAAKAPILDELLFEVEIDLGEVRRERRDSPLYRDEDLDLALRELDWVRRRRFGRSEGERS
ncbi:MAG: carbon-nitrogen hydrolase [Gemmatimonadetes bacterium]|nr:carbon-nitrogen hydrolase [Gemmatimonadota bacterium]